MFEKCLYFNSNALARTVTRLWADAYAEFGLSPPHAFLLRVVLAKPGSLQRELAEELDLSRSTVTRFLDSLEARGLLRRRSTGTDGREVQIHPTPKAKAMRKELERTGETLTKRMIAMFGERDISKTVSDLREIRRRLERS